MKKGIVVATHPSDHSVDVVLSDGRRLTGVQVMTPNGSARSGTFDMPAVPDRQGDKWDIRQTNGQDQVAIVEFVGEVPVVVGFLFPQVSQMTFADPKMRVVRHQSDVMTSIDGDGNVQLSHPSGTYIRIGESPDQAPMAGVNTDKNLAADRNTGRLVNVRIGLAGGVLDLTLSPTGQVTLRTQQGVMIEADAPVTVKAPTVTLDTPKVIATSNLQVRGDLIVEGSTSLQGVTSRGTNVGNDHRHQFSGGPSVGGVPV